MIQIGSQNIPRNHGISCERTSEVTLLTWWCCKEGNCWVDNLWLNLHGNKQKCGLCVTVVVYAVVFRPLAASMVAHSSGQGAESEPAEVTPQKMPTSLTTPSLLRFPSPDRASASWVPLLVLSLFVSLLS